MCHDTTARVVTCFLCSLAAGNSSYIQMQNTNFYSTAGNKTFAWQAFPVTQTAPYICEVSGTACIAPPSGPSCLGHIQCGLCRGPQLCCSIASYG